MPERNEKRTPRDLLRVMFRRRRLFLVGACVFALGVLIGAHQLPFRYTGTAKLLLAIDPAVEGRSAAQSFEDLKLALLIELAGYESVERAVEENLRLTEGLPHDKEGRLTPKGERAKQELIRAFMNGIDLKWDFRSQSQAMVSVSFTHPDPELAQKLPNELVRNYKIRNREERLERLTKSREFLLGKVRECDANLRESNRKKAQFEEEHAGALPDSPGTLQERIEQINADMDAVRRQEALARQKIARLKARLERFSQPTTGPASQPTQVVMGPNPELAQLKDELKEAEDTLREALDVRQMKEKHPAIQDLRRKITYLTERIQETPEEVVVQKVYGGGADNLLMVREDLRMELMGAEAEADMAVREIQRLEARLAVYQQVLGNYGKIRQDYLQILKTLEDQRSELKRWKSQLDKVEMDLAAELENRRMHVEPRKLAMRQFVPSSPQLWTVLALSLLGGLGFGGGLVFLANGLDRSINQTEDAARHFSLPIHGVIGEIITPQQKTVRSFNRFVVTPLLAAILLTALGLATHSIVLWLLRHEEWSNSPAGYICRHVTDLAMHLTEIFRG